MIEYLALKNSSFFAFITSERILSVDELHPASPFSQQSSRIPFL